VFCRESFFSWLLQLNTVGHSLVCQCGHCTIIICASINQVMQTSLARYLLHPHKVWKYCDECVCLSARISPEPHVRSLPNFLCMLSMAMARSSSGVIAISYVLPVLWPYSGMNFAMKDRFHLSLLIYRKFGQNTISYH